MKSIDISAIEAEGYLIKLNGEVLNRNRTRVLKPTKTSDGYLKVSLVLGGVVTKFRVHRLVAMKFTPLRVGCHEVNHKDGDRANNAAPNLEWVSRCENNFHKSHGQWHEREAIFSECQRMAKAGLTMRDISRSLGVSTTTIFRWKQNCLTPLEVDHYLADG
ncbi:TPA: HNH endonuclease [Yersinia enterocolitica]|nr:HNH endonuclease [Yersinia enterocolitica]HEN3546450.1 HNH endonuclease [Yersinia enterocolitica]